tara:strand:- start:3984 stop:4331 length:348 start_codon:yes stop_codon:yes gene_type:complete
MDKGELIENIKEWIKLDNELKELQKAAKERREKKKELTANLVDVMKTNEIDCFDVNDGKLIYTKNKVKGTLSKKQLLNSLQTFYKDKPGECKKVTEFLLSSREEKVKESIRRKIN